MASPLLGYNNNVRHQGKLFHIQTEDSGTTHAHIFTHLFADGGRIIATKKTTYAQYVGTARFPEAVKKLMQAQHKAMFIALRDGLFDKDELAGAREFAARQIVLDDEPPPPSQQLDVDALDRLAESYLTPSSPGATAPGITSPGAVPAPKEPPPGPAAPRATPAHPPTASSPGRYQATTPVKPQPAARPAPAPAAKSDSLFGEGLLSEKSLDEVILSYLAEDIDPKDGGG